jgi:hypothetical protein
MKEQSILIHCGRIEERVTHRVGLPHCHRAPALKDRMGYTLYPALHGTGKGRKDIKGYLAASKRG